MPLMNAKYSYTASARLRTDSEFITSETLFFASTHSYAQCVTIL